MMELLEAWRGFGLLAVLIGVVLVGACQESATSPPSADAARQLSVERAIALGEEAGRLHRDLQEFMLDRLLAEREDKGRLTRGTLESVSMKACIDWMKKVDAEPGNCGVMRAKFAQAKGEGAAGAVAPLTGPGAASLTGPSQELVSLLNGLESALSSASSPSAYQQTAMTLLGQAMMQLDTIEIYAFAAAKSVGDDSSNYWPSQAETWETIGYPDCEDEPDHPACGGVTNATSATPAMACCFGWVQDWVKRVVGADLAGASAAAVYNWIAGPGAAGPVGAAAGAASAGQLALEAWAWLTEE